MYAIYDQGSKVVYLLYPDLRASTAAPLVNLTSLSAEYTQQAAIIAFNPALVAFYALFFPLLAAAIFLYYNPRKRLKFLRTGIRENIMEIRKMLRCDPRYDRPLGEKWSSLSAKDKNCSIRNVNDYLIIDDFYSEVEKRNMHLQGATPVKQSDLSSVNTLTRFNEAVLAAAENVLNKVDWNKYR